MKKILAITSVLVASTNMAMAEYNDPTMLDNWDMNKFYIGGDLGYSKFDYNSTLDAAADDTLPLLNVYMGYEINPYYAVEFGAFTNKKEDRTVGATTTSAKEYGMFVDAVGKYDIYQDFAALGTLGIQYSKFKSDNGTTEISETEFAPRLGAGLEYKVSDDMKVRGMVRYVFSDYDGQVDNTMQYTIGMNYSF